MPRFTTRFSVEDVAKVDVRYLARHGMIEPGYSGTLSWRRGSERLGSISVYGHGTEVTLAYRWREERVEQRVRLDSTECNLGGERVWFQCPCCGRRCAILYGPHRDFACRLCYRLDYESQRTNGRYVAITRMHKVLKRLGAQPDTMTFPDRPKGMHRRTYRRLRHEYETHLRTFGAYVEHRFKST